VKIVNLENVEKTIPAMEGASGVRKQVPISKHDGAPTFSFRVFTIDPGGHTPFHRHPYEHVNYVIEGMGVVVAENGEQQAIKKGDFALVLPDEKHQYRNTSETIPLIVICAVPRDFE
jgi:quercetin dioxygenase-like cupin family protein